MKVFVFGSFSRLLGLIAQQLVSEEQLRHGLFVLGCRRIHAYQPGTGEVDERTWVRPPLDGHAAHTVLVAALKAADEDGRATWWRDAWPEGCRDAGEAMDDLLRLLGIKAEDCNWEHGREVKWKLEDFREDRLAEKDRLLGIKTLFEEAVELDRLRQFGGPKA